MNSEEVKVEEVKIVEVQEETKEAIKEVSEVTVVEDIKPVSPMSAERKKNIPLASRDISRLSASGYGKNNSKFNNKFVIRNTDTGQIVELRAASAFHAANMIGWKPRKVELLEMKTA